MSKISSAKKHKNNSSFFLLFDVSVNRSELPKFVKFNKIKFMLTKIFSLQLNKVLQCLKPKINSQIVKAVTILSSKK